MPHYSFIDFGLKDFLRKEDGEVVRIEFEGYHDAEEWLLKYGEDYGWTNKGVRYWNWDEEDNQPKVASKT